MHKGEVVAEVRTHYSIINFRLELQVGLGWGLGRQWINGLERSRRTTPDGLVVCFDVHVQSSWKTQTSD